MPRYTQTVRYTLEEQKLQGTKVPRSERTFVPGSEKAWERKFQGARRPGSERAKERNFQGVNWPESYWPIHSGERIGPGAKRLGTKNLTAAAAHV